LCARLIAVCAPAGSAARVAAAPAAVVLAPAPAASAPLSPAGQAPARPAAPPPASAPQTAAIRAQRASPSPEPVRAPTGDIADGAEDSELVRRRWPEVLGTLERRRVTWAMVSQSAQVAGVEAGVLRLAFDNGALAARFTGGEHAENVALAVRETLGLHVRVEAITAPGAETGTFPVQPPATGSVPQASPASGPTTGETPAVPEPDEEPHDIAPDDPAAPDEQLMGADAVAKLLGGTVIEDD